MENKANSETAKQIEDSTPEANVENLYKGYTIYPNDYPTENSQFCFHLADYDGEPIDFGKSVEDCKSQIDALISDGIPALNGEETTDKLTLEHLAPYLPYGLKVLYQTKSTLPSSIHVMNYLNLNDNIGLLDCPLTDWTNLDYVKPILRPLSDLLKEDSENYELMLSLCDILNSSTCEHFIKAIQEKTYYGIDLRLYDEICKFMDGNHFDWRFGLIDKGIAIDINSLNKN